MSKHTPGPWVGPDEGMYIIACDARQTLICRVYGAPSNHIAQADARLIAAAPDLLAALRDVYAIASAIFADSEHDEYAIALAKDAKARIRRVANTAIAKAEGRDA